MTIFGGQLRKDEQVQLDLPILLCQGEWEDGDLADRTSIEPSLVSFR
jgi:hypothetical protein